jgi:hypothetical protein
MRLTDASMAERYRAALLEVRHLPEKGDVLLSYVIWPDELPPLRLSEPASGTAKDKRSSDVRD